MKKLFLLLAFTGIVAAGSASTVMSLNNVDITVVGEGDKKGDKDKKKKKCKKGKSCCKAKEGATAKACSGEAGEKKACCKSKAHAKK